MANFKGPLEETVDFAISSHKKKGCSAVIQFIGSEENHEIFLGGHGTAVYSRTEDGQPESPEQLLAQDTVSMEWVFNRFHGQHNHFGEFTADFSNSPTGQSSRVLMISDSLGKSIFPGTLMNMLYFTIDAKDLGIRFYNKDPMVLRSKPTNLTREFAENTPQFRRHPNGQSRYHRQLFEDEKKQNWFAPFGVHSLQAPVELYSDQSPEKPVARMVKAQVESGPSFGLDINVLKSGKHKNSTYSIVVRIQNMTEENQNIRWDVGTIGNLKLDGQDTGSAILTPMENDGDYIDLKINAGLIVPGRELGRMDLLFVAASSIAAKYEDLVCGFISLAAGSDE